MSQPLVKSLIDEQVEEVAARSKPVTVRGAFQFPRSMRVADLEYPMKAEWLKRRPITGWG